MHLTHLTITFATFKSTVVAFEFAYASKWTHLLTMKWLIWDRMVLVAHLVSQHLCCKGSPHVRMACRAIIM